MQTGRIMALDRTLEGKELGGGEGVAGRETGTLGHSALTT